MEIVLATVISYAFSLIFYDFCEITYIFYFANFGPKLQTFFFDFPLEFFLLSFSPPQKNIWRQAEAWFERRGTI